MSINYDMTGNTLLADAITVTGAISASSIAVDQVYSATGSTKTLTHADRGKTFKLDTAAGCTVTLPAASGTGDTFKFIVTVLATSNAHVIQVANSSDAMQGIIFTGDDTSANAQWFAAVAGTSDTITLNRTTTGSVTIGEWIEVEDIAANRWQVRGFITNTGTAATPFSAAV